MVEQWLCLLSYGPPCPPPPSTVPPPPRRYRHMGSFAYVGVDQAILSLPASFGPFNALKGWLVGDLAAVVVMVV